MDSLPPRSRTGIAISHNNTIDYEKILNSIRRSRNETRIYPEDFKTETNTKLKFFTRKTTGSATRADIKILLKQHTFMKEWPTEKELNRIWSSNPRDYHSYALTKETSSNFDETMLHPALNSNNENSRNSSPSLSKNSKRDKRKCRNKITIGMKKQSINFEKLINENPELFDFINRQSNLDPQQHIEKLSKKQPMTWSDVFVTPNLEGNRRNSAKIIEKYIANLLKYIGNH